MNKKTLLLLVAMSSSQISFAASPQELLTSYETKSAKAVPARGQQFFNAKHGKEWSCASCHDSLPNHETKHIVTGKVIQALSPVRNSARFSDPSKVEKWFKRNCNDVLGRECDAQEKADVLSWLMTVK
jgi:hypothetical protein